MSEQASVFEAMETAATDAITAFTTEHLPPDTTPTPSDKPAETPPAEPKPPVLPAKDDEPAPTPPAEKPEDQKPEDQKPEDQKPTALPDGYVAVPTVTDQLVTEFKVRDGEDEIEIPALVIEYKANGKVRKDRLDQVVRAAQRGMFSMEREQQMLAREQQATATTQQVQDVLSVREAQLEAILTDPEVYEQARERYLQANTPDRKVERLQQQIRERDAKAAQVQHQQQARQFAEQEIAPALQTIAEACPEVGVDELQMKLAMAMYPLMERGVVPAAKYPLIRAYIIHELTEWAEDTHAKRFSRTPQPKPVTPPKKVEPSPSQVQAHHEKRSVAQQVRPAGRGGAPGATPAASAAAKKAATIDGALEDAMADVSKFIRTTG